MGYIYFVTRYYNGSLSSVSLCSTEWLAAGVCYITGDVDRRE